MTYDKYCDYNKQLSIKILYTILRLNYAIFQTIHSFGRQIDFRKEQLRPGFIFDLSLFIVLGTVKQTSMPPEDDISRFRYTVPKGSLLHYKP